MAMRRLPSISSFLRSGHTTGRFSTRSLSATKDFGEVTVASSKLPSHSEAQTTYPTADPREARFTYTEKQVNPNNAMDLIAEQKPIACEGRVTFCDGGHAGLGHPKVFINMDKPGTHACGYCGLRFYNSHVTSQDQLGIAHIQV